MPPFIHFFVKGSYEGKIFHIDKLQEEIIRRFINNGYFPCVDASGLARPCTAEYAICLEDEFSEFEIYQGQTNIFCLIYWMDMQPSNFRLVKGHFNRILQGNPVPQGLPERYASFVQCERGQFLGGSHTDRPAKGTGITTIIGGEREEEIQKIKQEIIGV